MPIYHENVQIAKIIKKEVRKLVFLSARVAEYLESKGVYLMTRMKGISIFVLALKHQIWRRYFYLYNKKGILQSYKTRKGECKRCGGCCKPSFKCPNLVYDKNGLSCCKINHKKPHLCELYPYNQRDFFKHLRDKCGFRYEE